jgi:hypothetical protein
MVKSDPDPKLMLKPDPDPMFFIIIHNTGGCPIRMPRRNFLRKTVEERNFQILNKEATGNFKLSEVHLLLKLY